jgi:IclR family acetate operon transcriptional repressor
MLFVLEEIARNQPVSIAELARLMEEDKSGIQRSVMTLADAGWIAMTPGMSSRWQVTSHIQVVAKIARENDNMQRTARGVMEKLRDAVLETVVLLVPDVRQFVVIEVVESKQLVRTAPKVGLVIPAHDTVTARAYLPFVGPSEQTEFLGRTPGDADLETFELSRSRGYAAGTHSYAHTNEGREAIGSASIAAPVLDLDGHPVALLLISGPSERLPTERQEELGQLLVRAAQEISRGARYSAPAVPDEDVVG